MIPRPPISTLFPYTTLFRSQVKTAAADAPAKYAGALDGFMDKVNGAAFDPVLFTHKLYESAALRMSFQAQNRGDAEQWQKNLRVKLTDLLGGFPAKRVPLETQ